MSQLNITQLLGMSSPWLMASKIPFATRHPNGFQQFGWSLKGKGTGLDFVAMISAWNCGKHGQNMWEPWQKKEKKRTLPIYFRRRIRPVIVLAFRAFQMMTSTRYRTTVRCTKQSWNLVSSQRTLSKYSWDAEMSFGTTQKTWQLLGFAGPGFGDLSASKRMRSTQPRPLFVARTLGMWIAPPQWENVKRCIMDVLVSLWNRVMWLKQQ